MRSLLLAALPALLVVGPASAEKRDFERCDGLRAPGSKNGGMNGPVSADWFDGAMRHADAVAAGRALVASCDAALADPRLLPTATVRRAHLLRARALAALQTGDADAALRDLDAAQAAAGALAQDPLFVRSMGVSLSLARAAAWQVKGDRAKARAFAAEAAAARPYSVSIQSLATLIAQRARDVTQTAPANTYALLLPLNPAARDLQFSEAVAEGRFAQAAATYPLLKHDYPAPRWATLQSVFMVEDAQTLVSSVVHGGQAAYAYAAIGDSNRARATLTEVATRTETALKRETDKKGVLQPESQLAAPLRALIARATMMTEARLAIAAGKPTEALSPLVGTALPVTAESVDLLTALRAALPEAQRAMAPDPAAFAAKVAEKRLAETLDIAVLRKAMPAPETSGTLAGYDKAGSAFVASLFLGAGASKDGFRSKTDPATGTVTVEFVGAATSAPVVEEMTLLRAADLARQAGKPALLIRGRRDFARTMNVTRGYSSIPVSSTPAGYKTELTVRFVDPAALPADLAGERDRLLDAERIYATLAPVYIPAPVGGAAKARR